MASYRTTTAPATAPGGTMGADNNHIMCKLCIFIADQAATMTGEEAVGYLSCLSTSMHAQDHALL